MWSSSTSESMGIKHSKGGELAEKLLDLIDDELEASRVDTGRLRDLTESLSTLLGVIGSKLAEQQADRSIEAPELKKE